MRCYNRGEVVRRLGAEYIVGGNPTRRTESRNPLLLTQWKPMFAWLPVEPIIHDGQDGYYAAINRSNYEEGSTASIAFMLSASKEALIEAVRTRGAAESMTIDQRRWYKSNRFLKKNDTITNADVRQIFRVSSATANCILCHLAVLHPYRYGRTDPGYEGTVRLLGLSDAKPEIRIHPNAQSNAP